MSDWTGSGTTISSSTSTGCLEYLSVADVRTEFGDDVAEMTDAQIQRRIDRLAASLEETLGHTFGRAMVARSTASHTVQVTATALIFNATSYLFADNPTLWDLCQSVEAAGQAYSLEILPQIDPATPSTLLKTMGPAVCGPNLENRAVLCISAMYVKLTGSGNSHAFLPLPLTAVASITENGLTLTASDYWAVPGELWLTRKLCGCATNGCRHPHGRWSNAYPGNLAVTYVPRFWGRVPQVLTGPMLDAFKLEAGFGLLESESFGEYSYRKAAKTMTTPWEALSGGQTRMYSVSFHP